MFAQNGKMMIRLPEEPTKRVLQIKQEFLNTVPEMCCSRALIYTQVYQDSEEGLPVILTRARALKKTLEEMPIFILPGEVIVGHPASKPRSAEVFPEVNISVVDEIDEFETREYNRLRVSPEVKDALLKIAPFWRGKTPHDYLEKRRPEAIRKAFSCGLLSDPHEWSGFAHVAMDYRKILLKGIQGLKKEISACRRGLKQQDPEFMAKAAFYEAEEMICQGILAFAERYRKLVFEQAENEKDPERKVELLEMANVLEHVPAQPAHSYHEALQAVWFMQLLPQIESNGFSISPGRLDQYCNTYLEADLEAGRITIDKAQELTDLFWLKFCEILRVDSRGAAEVNAGYASGQNIAVGGIDTFGNDCSNLLSYLCLNANKHISLHQPNFSVRLHDKTPNHFLDAVIDSISGGNGMPQLLNDECIVPSLTSRGMPLDESRDYIAVGCDEISLHRHWARCNGGYINMAKILEITLGNGTDLRYKVPVFDPVEEKPENFDAFMKIFYRFFREGIALQVAEADMSDDIHRELLPLPFVSLFLDDCIANGRDCTDGGAHYNTTGLVAVGSATVGDSLEAIRKLVYMDHRLKLDEYVEILQNNYEGKEPLRQFILNRIPKFGNDIDSVDDLVVGITDLFADELKKYTPARGGEFWPALYSVSAQVGMGNVCGATPDGRRLGLPLSDGLTPMYGMDRKGPTAALASLSKVHHTRFPNGIIINQRLNGTLFRKKSGREKVGLLIRAFVKDRNFHWQFNIVDNEVLLAAQANPDEYRGLVVRVAGYSAIFVDLSLKAQNSIIERYAGEL